MNLKGSIAAALTVVLTTVGAAAQDDLRLALELNSLNEVNEGRCEASLFVSNRSEVAIQDLEIELVPFDFRSRARPEMVVRVGRLEAGVAAIRRSTTPVACQRISGFLLNEITCGRSTPCAVTASYRSVVPGVKLDRDESLLAFAGQGDPARVGYVITMSWPVTDDDIDLYVQGPDGALARYHQRGETSYVELTRDDRGGSTERFRDVGPVDMPINEERVLVRRGVPGRYTVNIYRYVAATDSVPVTVRIDTPGPFGSVLYARQMTLTHRGQEETAFRFTLGQDGAISDLNTEFRSLVALVRKPVPGPRPDGEAQPVAPAPR